MSDKYLNIDRAQLMALGKQGIKMNQYTIFPIYLSQESKRKEKEKKDENVLSKQNRGRKRR